MSTDPGDVAAEPTIAALLGLRQSRIFLPDPVPEADLERLLEVARWTGSAKNTQPWHLVVVTDRDDLRALAGFGAFTSFLAGVAVAVVVALDGDNRATAFDDGRLQERVMLAADVLGLGSGTGWFSGAEPQQQVRDLLGIPEGLTPWSAIGLGFTDTSTAQPGPDRRGRRPLTEIVSRGRYGA